MAKDDSSDELKKKAEQAGFHLKPKKKRYTIVISEKLIKELSDYMDRVKPDKFIGEIFEEALKDWLKRNNK